MERGMVWNVARAGQVRVGVTWKLPASWVAAGVEGGGAVAAVGQGARPASQDYVIGQLCKKGQLKEAVEAVEGSRKEGIRVSVKLFLRLLQECIKRKDLVRGKKVHALILKDGYGGNMFLQSNLVRMYAVCGSMKDARAVFDGMAVRNTFSWTAIISGYVQEKRGGEALKFFGRMKQEGVQPDSYTFVSLIRACTSLTALEEGKKIHATVKEAGFESDVFVGNTLVDMYAKCGALKEARRVFDGLAARDVVSWTALIAGYAQHGHGDTAVSLFEKMQEGGVSPNAVTLVSVLKGCHARSDVKQGQLIHEYVGKSRYKADLFVRTALVDMYAKCGKLEEARRVFDELEERDLVLWNAIIGGYSQHGQGEEALQLFHAMQRGGSKVQPDAITFVGALRACASPPNLAEGRIIHNLACRSGYEANDFVRSALIDMYAKCGSLADSLEVFEKVQNGDVVTWTAMIFAYAHHGQSQKALELFDQLQREGLKPDGLTFASVLKACASPEHLERVKQLHALIKGGPYESDTVVQNTLLAMYAKCGSIADAVQVFDRSSKENVVTWNAMLAGYTEAGRNVEARELFDRMGREGVEPDIYTYATLLNGCSGEAGLEQAKSIHAKIKEGAILPDLFLENTLVTVYSKCGSLANARDVFDQMEKRDVVSWTAMMSACVEHGQEEEAHALFPRMQEEGVVPNIATFLSALKSCSSPGSLEYGKQVHADIIKSGSASNLYIGNSLVDMYARCGSLESARQVFDNMPNRDSVSWSSLITSYVQQGKHDEALALFRKMELEDWLPNSTAFIKIIKACSG